MMEFYLKIKNSVFWGKWGVWILVLIASTFLGYLGSQSFIDGYNDVRCNTNGIKSTPIILSFENKIIIGFFLSIIWIPFFFLIFLLGLLHYHVIFKPILSKLKIQNIVFYIIISYLIYLELMSDTIFTKLLKIQSWEASAWSAIIWATSLLGAILINQYENKEKHTAQEIEKHKLEIKALKAQINPHFLFNTLNNLMGTAISENAPKTSLQIQQLAGIMRHVVEETQADFTPIEKELKFLGDYIELMEIRIPKEENIKINIQIEYDENTFLISPLLLITFIENAFKYGVSINHPCFVDIKLKVENKKVELICKNAIVNAENSTETGLESVKKRLDLTYPNQYSLRISEEKNVFSIHLILDLSNENPTV